MLYICPTPIGNLDDITLRVIKTLEEVDLILAEDTRHTQKLLNHLNIKTKTTSYHAHNYMAKGASAIKSLQEGRNLALVSDAGMPAISDPGIHLVKLCIENSLEFTVLPGPSACITALVASGLPTDKFTFIGFLPVKPGKRKKALETLSDINHTLIFYEGPHKLLKALHAIKETLGDRDCAVARELTKKFEEVIRGKVSEIIKHFEHTSPRGEFVILLSSAAPN